MFSSAVMLFMLLYGTDVYAVEDIQQETQVTATFRVQVNIPQDTVIPDGVVAQLQYWLGARTVQRIRPPVGTQLTVVASAYAPSVYQTDSTPCVTAAGTRVRRGVVASNFLPMGTLLHVDDDIFIVEDRMNPRFSGYYIDIFFPHTHEALEFGRKRLAITIIGYGKPGQELPPELLLVKEGQVHEPTQTPTNLSSSDDEDADQGLAKRLQLQLQIVSRTISQLIGARVPADVNRYDVDCLSNE